MHYIDIALVALSCYILVIGMFTISIYSFSDEIKNENIQ
jgi:hypothetical protein